jgi:hypothetical protein
MRRGWAGRVCSWRGLKGGWWLLVNLSKSVLVPSSHRDQVAEESEAKKKAEESLAESEAKLKQVADMAREKVMALSKENAELKKGKKR